MWARVILFWFFAIASLFANGGGYSYGIEFTGGIRPFEPEGVEQISIEEETLNIVLHAKHADVEVRYRMKNEGAKKKIKFGFPVEAPDPIWHVVEHSVDQPKGFSAYEVLVGGRKVQSDWQAVVSKAREVDAIRLKGLSGWMVSSFSFPKETELLVTITYQVEHSGSVVSISDDVSRTTRKFDYRFSTGAVWKGKIGKGRVVIRLGEGLEKDEVEFLQPSERFEWKDGAWGWNFTDFEPTLADDLKIEVGEAIEVRGNYGGLNDSMIHSWIRKGDVWSEEHSKYEVKASSTLPAEGEYSYQADNVKVWGENGNQMCWSEAKQGAGVGEWLEFKPVEARVLTGFHIAGGYWEDEFYHVNARPKLVTIALNDDYTFKAELPDEQSWENWVWIPDYSKPVKKVRMTFDEVYPGKLYEDLCVTRVTFLAKLAKEPKHQGAR